MARGRVEEGVEKTGKPSEITKEDGPAKGFGRHHGTLPEFSGMMLGNTEGKEKRP